MNIFYAIVAIVIVLSAAYIGTIERNNSIECKKAAIEKNYTAEQIKEICGGR